MFYAEFIVAPTCLMLDRCRWQEQLKMEIEIDFYNKFSCEKPGIRRRNVFASFARESLARYFEEED